MLVYIFMIFALSYSNVCSFISYFNGIEIRYGVTSYATCMVIPASSRLVSLKDISVSVCLQHCAVTQNCVGLNYRRKFKLCDLFSGNGSLINSGDCIYISRTDTVFQNESCKEVCDNRQICDQDGNCSQKVCNYPEVPNGHTLGNLMTIGGTQVIECSSGFIRRGSRTIKCMDNGTWDTIPECWKETDPKTPNHPPNVAETVIKFSYNFIECNITVFQHADIETFTNTSGVNAFVRCHEKYISNRTTSIDGVITEETVGCDINGNWTPNIDCIYINNLFNIALKKKATQSSTYNDMVAERAIDGIWDGSYLGGSCSQTLSNDTMAWLEIDLQQTYTIRRVKILYWNFGWSSSSVGHVNVTIGNQSNPKTFCNFYGDATNSTMEAEYICSPALTGRYVRLNKQSISYFYSLRVCEVGIYEI